MKKGARKQLDFTNFGDKFNFKETNIMLALSKKYGFGKQDQLGLCENTTTTTTTATNTNTIQDNISYKALEENELKPLKELNIWPDMEKVPDYSSLTKCYIQEDDRSYSDIMNDENINNTTYNNLIVSLNEILESPIKPQSQKSSVNTRNKINETGETNFIKSGTNLVSSIWSNETAEPKNDDRYFLNNTNNTLNDSYPAFRLDFKIDSFPFDSYPCLMQAVWQTVRGIDFNYDNNFLSFWDQLEKRNEKRNDNDLLENGNTKTGKKKSLKTSLKTINHDSETSPFSVVIPKKNTKSSLQEEEEEVCQPVSVLDSTDDNKQPSPSPLTYNSEEYRFLPIECPEEKLGKDQAETKVHPVVRCTSSERYCINSQNITNYFKELLSKGVQFGKENNSKACQTETVLKGISMKNEEMKNNGKKYGIIGHKNGGTSYNKCVCKHEDIENEYDARHDNVDYPFHCVTELQLQKDSLRRNDGTQCEKCGQAPETLNVDCSKIWQTDTTDWYNETLRNIWNKNETCSGCSNAEETYQQNIELIEDVSLDGEQLLSDIQCLQNFYMEEAPEECNISDNDKYPAADKYNIDSNQIWSCATRFEKDCIIQMSTIPTLRSVTL